MMVKTTVTMTMPTTTNDSSDDARLRRLYRHARTLHCTTTHTSSTARTGVREGGGKKITLQTFHHLRQSL